MPPLQLLQPLLNPLSRLLDNRRRTLNSHVDGLYTYNDGSRDKFYSHIIMYVIKPSQRTIYTIDIDFISESGLKSRDAGNPPSTGDGVTRYKTLPFSIDSYFAQTTDVFASLDNWVEYTLRQAKSNLFMEYNLAADISNMDVLFTGTAGCFERELTALSIVHVKSTYCPLSQFRLPIISDRYGASFPPRQIYTDEISAILAQAPASRMRVFNGTPGTDFYETDAVASEGYGGYHALDIFFANQVSLLSLSPTTIPSGMGASPTSAASRLEPKVKIKEPKAYLGMEKEREKDPSFTIITYFDGLDRYFASTSHTEDTQYNFARSCFAERALGTVKMYEDIHDSASRTYETFKTHIIRTYYNPVVQAQERNRLQSLTMPSPLTYEKLTDFNSSFNTTARSASYNLNSLGDDTTLRALYMSALDKGLCRILIDDKDFPSETILVQECHHPKTSNPFTLNDLMQAALAAQRRRETNKLVMGHQSEKRKREDEPDTHSKGKGGKKKFKKGEKGKSSQSSSRTINSVEDMQKAKRFTKEQRIAALKPGKTPKNGTFADGSPRTCNNCNSPDHFVDKCPQISKPVKAQFHALRTGNSEATEDASDLRYKLTKKKSGALTLHAILEEPEEQLDTFSSEQLTKFNTQLNSLKPETREAIAKLIAGDSRLMAKKSVQLPSSQVNSIALSSRPAAGQSSSVTDLLSMIRLN